MKKYLRKILLVIGLIIFGSSSLTLAQTELPESEELLEIVETVEITLTPVIESVSKSEIWFGISSSLHYIIPSMDIHMGFSDVLGEGMDLRTTLSSLVVDDGGYIAIGLNGMTSTNNSNSDVNNYVGFGPRFLFTYYTQYYTDDNYQETAGNSILGVGGFWGTEYNALGSIRPFYEFNASLPLLFDGQLLPAFIPVLSITTGFNFYF